MDRLLISRLLFASSCSRLRRSPCTNDLIVSREKSFRHAHIHLTEYEMTRRMA